jgi:quinoprotein glucose dehydrogenase
MKAIRNCFISPLFILVILISCNAPKAPEYNNWSVYGGNKENNRYSSLTQIDTTNVAQLQVAWQYHTGDSGAMTQIQVNPIVIGTTLYGVSPKLKLFAVDAATGTKKWLFDPVSDSSETKGSGYFSMNVCRGVSYYTDGKEERIFYAASSKLFCIDAKTGKPISTFGENGRIDLHNDLGTNAGALYVSSTTPGIIYKDLIIVGTRVSEEMPAASGHIRAYDVHTGKLKWIFHTIPQPGEPGYETWEDKEAYKHIGGANAWAGFSLDEKRGIVYAPIGSAVYDFYGGKRLGQNLYANSLLALDAATGKRIWHYQTVHHDIWDRDLPTAPSLVTLNKDEKKIDAVAQPTKSGFIFIFDRVTGQPLFPIEEKPVPIVSDLVGEQPNATQPFPSLPLPFARQSLTEKDLNNLVPDSSYQDIKKRLASYKTGFIYNPPSKQGTVIFPGFDGGAEWGGPAVDPATGIMYVNASEMPWILTMVDIKEQSLGNENNLQAGQRLYKTKCMACHGPERQGAGNFPNLIDIGKRYTQDSFIQLVSGGRRMMPAFNQLAESEKQALAAFVLDIKINQHKTFKAPAPSREDSVYRMPYSATGYNKFLTKEGYPAVAPPWGTLNAIDLNSGKLVWKDTLGDYPELKAKGLHTGTENYGGPAVTAGGLVFIAATSDAKMRAFNKRTGKLLWEADLPACGFATPAVYQVNGKQYLVIACGGGKLKKPSGDVYVAFALPEKKE